MTTTPKKQDGAPKKKPPQASEGKNAEKTQEPPAGAPDDAKPEPETEEIPGAEEARASEADGESADGDGGAQTDSAGVQDGDFKDRYIRLAADFQNYRRRAEKEKSDIYAYANEKIAVELLDVIDNFERALKSTGDTETREEGFAKGMELIFKQLLDILLKNGIEEIQSLGEDFDPAVHNAVMMEESDTYESGKVSAVLGKGYRLKDRVIRPAMVKVAQ
jgi:molecular chaperone GrpE